eukprot:1157478-Pelagomonas_calceolata.AAC.7
MAWQWNSEGQHDTGGPIFCERRCSCCAMSHAKLNPVEKDQGFALQKQLAAAYRKRMDRSVPKLVCSKSICQLLVQPVASAC